VLYRGRRVVARRAQTSVAAASVVRTCLVVTGSVRHAAETSAALRRTQCAATSRLCKGTLTFYSIDSYGQGFGKIYRLLCSRRMCSLQYCLFRTVAGKQ